MTRNLLKFSSVFLFFFISIISSFGQVISQTYITCTYVLQSNVTEPSCFGDGSGVVELVFTGITNNPELEWIYPDGSLPPANTTDSPSQDGLFAGHYKVRVADNIGCVDTISIIVTEPDEINLQANKNNVTCFGDTNGSVELSAVGGVGAFKFSLNGDDFSQDNIFEQLPPDEYEIFVKDQNNCIRSKIINIEEPNEPDMVVEKENVNCPDGNDAVFIVVIDSGVLLQGGEPDDYDYSLDGINYQPDSTFESLEAGEYTVFAKNTKGCISSKVEVISEPPPPVVIINKMDVKCNGDASGWMEVMMMGATPPYQFSLDNINFQSQNEFGNLPAGIYHLYILDANGCDFGYDFEMLEPTPLLNNITFTNATCGLPNGWILASANGGVSPFYFNWNTGSTEPTLTNLNNGNYKISITDSNGCQIEESIDIINEQSSLVEETIQDVICFDEKNGSIEVEMEGYPPFDFLWSEGDTIAKIKNLKAGNYTITITDKNNCITSQHFQVEQPDSISIFPNIENNGVLGNVILGVKGGTPPFSFEWNTGETTSELSDLSFGKYTVTVIDANDCYNEKTFELDLPNRNIELGEMIKIYPVPTIDDLLVEFNLPFSSEVELQIFDELGRRIYLTKPFETKRQTITLDLDRLAAGGYFIKIKSGVNVEVKRFVKVDR